MKLRGIKRLALSLAFGGNAITKEKRKHDHLEERNNVKVRRKKKYKTNHLNIHR